MLILMFMLLADCSRNLAASSLDLTLLEAVDNPETVDPEEMVVEVVDGEVGVAVPVAAIASFVADVGSTGAATAVRLGSSVLLR